MIMKVFINTQPIGEENFKKLQAKFPNVKFETEVEHSYDAEVMVVEPYFVKEENIKNYPNLKWIQSYRAGFDTVDFSILEKQNITFSNAKDIYSIAIAEDVIAKILVLNRNVRTYLKNMKNKEWKPNFNEPEIYNSTVGIVGTGSIAKEIAKRIKAFGTTVLGYRRSNKPVDHFDEILVGEAGLHELLKRSDYVVLTVPLNDETRGMINKDTLKLIKSNSLLINIARGDVVVQDDLIEALENGTIRGAGLDVCSPEPLPADSKLWELENVYLTPHCSAASPHISTRLTEMIIENLSRYIEGKEVLNIV